MSSSFSRRAFLQSATIAAVAMSLPLVSRSSHAAQDRATPQQVANSGFYRFSLGSYKLISISDGILSVPAAVFAGNATPDQLATTLKEGFQSETLSLNCNVLYVNTGQNQVLIDTGNGIASTTAGKLLANLQAAQVNPADIDTVIITHAHGDHVGGLVDQAGNSIFANARFYVSQVENDFWMQPEVTLPKIGVDAEFQARMISTAQKQLGLIQDRLTVFNVDSEIVPGIYAISAFGHTPGHVAIRIVSGDMAMTHTADVVHTHTVNLWNPDWKPIFDADADQAVETRTRVLGKIAADRELMFAYHFPFPGLGHLRPRETGGYEWEPVNWQFEE